MIETCTPGCTIFTCSKTHVPFKEFPKLKNLTAASTSRAANELLTVIYGTGNYPEVNEQELWKAVQSLHGKRASKIPWAEAVYKFFAHKKTYTELAVEYSVTSARIQEAILFGVRYLRLPLSRVTFEKKYPISELPINDEGDLRPNPKSR